MMQDILGSVWQQFSGEIMLALSSLVGAVIVQLLRKLGFSISKDQQDQMTRVIQDGIRMVEEEAARRKLDPDASNLTGEDKAEIVKAYTFEMLKQNRSVLTAAIAPVVGKVFKSFALPSEVKVQSKIDASLKPMGVGAAAGVEKKEQVAAAKVVAAAVADAGPAVVVVPAAVVEPELGKA